MPNDMSHEARELSLWIDNTKAFYDMTNAAFAVLARHHQRGQYDTGKAVHAFAAVTDAAARHYARQFGTPDQPWHAMFNKAARTEVCREYARRFESAVRDNCLDDLGQKAAAIMRQPFRQHWTLSQIKYANDQAGGKFFSRENMRFAGDTMRSFTVRHEGEHVIIERVRPIRDRDGRDMGGVGRRWRFDPTTGQINTDMAHERTVTA